MNIQSLIRMSWIAVVSVVPMMVPIVTIGWSIAAADDRPTVAIMIGESEYRSEETLPKWADEFLKQDYRVVLIIEDPQTENHFPGIEQIDDADVLMVSVRRKTLASEQLRHVRDFVRNGKPVIGIRTASHAFSLRNEPTPAGTDTWPEFDAEVFGGHYTNHFPKGSESIVMPEPENRSHPILRGITITPFRQPGTLYKTSPLSARTTVLLTGRVIQSDAASEPVAWTFRRADRDGGGGESFYTSLGHPSDFENPVFTKILRQSIDWAVATSADVAD